MNVEPTGQKPPLRPKSGLIAVGVGAALLLFAVFASVNRGLSPPAVLVGALGLWYLLGVALVRSGLRPYRPLWPRGDGTTLIAAVSALLAGSGLLLDDSSIVAGALVAAGTAGLLLAVVLPWLRRPRA